MGKRDISIEQGKTFSLVIRWETEPIIYKAISAIQNVAPIRMTVTGHGLPNGWRCAVTGVKDIDTEANNVRDKDYHAGTVIDANTLEINDINAAAFKPYTSGGYLQYNTPVDMAGFSARMKIRDAIGGTELASYISPTNIAIDNTAKTITLTISAVDTAGFTWTRGVYDLEMVSGSGVVSAILSGDVTVTKEVTTT